MRYSKPSMNPFFVGLKESVGKYFDENAHGDKGNRGFYTKGTVIFSIYMAAYASIFFLNFSMGLLAVCYIILGITAVMSVFNIVHDASHHAVFKGGKRNDHLRYLGDILGINTYIWDIRHNKQHHLFTNILGGDLIIENIPLIRLSPHQPYKRLHRYQLYYTPVLYFFYSLYWIFIIDFMLFSKKEICNYKDIQHPKSEWIKLFLFKAFYLFYMIILPWVLTPLTIWQVIGLFLLMHAVGGLLLSIVAVLGHFVVGPSFPSIQDGVIDKSWSEHELEATIDFAPGSRIINWITGGLNTHVAHHLFPRMCHIHYYGITPIIERYCQQNGYSYKKETFAGALFSHFRYLKQLSVP